MLLINVILEKNAIPKGKYIWISKSKKYATNMKGRKFVLETWDEIFYFVAKKFTRINIKNSEVNIFLMFKFVKWWLKMFVCDKYIIKFLICLGYNCFLYILINYNKNYISEICHFNLFILITGCNQFFI